MNDFTEEELKMIDTCYRTSKCYYVRSLCPYSGYKCNEFFERHGSEPFELYDEVHEND